MNQPNLRLIQGGLSLKTKICKHCNEKLTAINFNTLNDLESGCLHNEEWLKREWQLRELMEEIEEMEKHDEPKQ